MRFCQYYAPRLRVIFLGGILAVMLSIKRVSLTLYKSLTLLKKVSWHSLEYVLRTSLTLQLGTRKACRNKLSIPSETSLILSSVRGGTAVRGKKSEIFEWILKNSWCKRHIGVVVEFEYFTEFHLG